MRDIFLQAAGVLAVATALVHAYLGETLVFSRARIELTRTALLLRLIWQAGAIGWLSLGLLLLAARVPGVRPCTPPDRLCERAQFRFRLSCQCLAFSRQTFRLGGAGGGGRSFPRRTLIGGPFVLL